VTAGVILGCGFTGQRVAALLAARGLPVYGSSRTPAPLAGVVMGTLAETLERAPAGCAVLYSIPPTDVDDPLERALGALAGRAARVVYLSSTGVYGATVDVDEHTPPAPRTPRELARVAAEEAVLAGPWSACVLRPAAIYGPFRGVHQSMREGRFRLWGAGANFVSRIHVDDLAALAAAATAGTLEGCWPVADAEPARSVDICRWVSARLGLPLPAPAPEAALHETRRANRRVDGRALAWRLGVPLRYPSYREGIEACLMEEKACPPHQHGL
jgi:nucleoside-diphosphate-sugar epimerase